MTKHDDFVRLGDMLDAALRVVRITNRLTEREFIEDEAAAPATVRFLEVIGEAARHVSEEIRNKHSEIPWRQLIGTRNLLIHAYASVDLGIVWNICQTAVPKLVLALEKIMDEHNGK